MNGLILHAQITYLAGRWDVSRRLPERQFAGAVSTDGVNLALLVDYLKQDWIKSAGGAVGSGFRGEDFTVIPRMGDR